MGPLAVVFFVGSCSFDGAQKDAVCERSVAIEIAVTRTGTLAKDVKGMNAAVLRSQLSEDIMNLTATLDVAPASVTNDLATVVDRLRDLYAALELLDWDSARFVGDERLDKVLERLDSVNTRRHLARLMGYLVDSCAAEGVSGSAPPDSVVAIPQTSTSVPLLDDPIAGDQDLLTAHVAMGTAIAEGLGVPVSVDQAECLGRESDALQLESEESDPRRWQELWDVALRVIFQKCGVSVGDRPGP